MTELQQGRYDQLLRRVGDLKGPGSKVNEVLEDLFPVMEVENTTPELLALTGWRPAWQSTERPASVGDTSGSQLRNPAASGHIMAVTQVVIETDAVTTLQLQLSEVLFGTPVSGLFRDSRFGTPRSTVGQVSSADGPVSGGGLRFTLESADRLFLRDDNGMCVLTPGANLNVVTTTRDRLILVNYFWRERIAEPSELNF